MYSTALKKTCSDHFKVIPEEFRVSVPAQGRSLGAIVERYQKLIKEAVSVLASGRETCPGRLHELFYHKRDRAGCTHENHETDRLEWFVINVCLLYAFTYGNESLPQIANALKWFLNKTDFQPNDVLASLDPWAIKQAEDVLAKVELSLAFFDVLPYILEPHGHVTRGTLERDPGAEKTRDKKRSKGMFYTPSDVAGFMTRSLILQETEQRKWLDPACGTGVFLREVLRLYHSGIIEDKGCESGIDFCSRNIYGMDICATSTDSCAFVLLSECAFQGSFDGSSPFHSWEKIRGNLAVQDSLDIAINCFYFSAGRSLQEIFPEAPKGFDHVIMNPPYSNLIVTPQYKKNFISFSTLPDLSNANICIAFVEMMTAFTSNKGNSAAVLPLSVGASTVSSFKQCRKVISETAGSWEFLFFDREPHALFGEDIKTRNVILFHKRGKVDCEVKTSGLLKWSSKNRASIFSDNRLVTLPNNNISHFVPKLACANEVTTYNSLASSCQPKFTSAHFSRSFLSDICKAALPKHVYIGGTAYNFINCFKNLPDISNLNKPLSESMVISMGFDTEESANAAYSILTSRLAYWLWHVEGDGFHVTTDFIRRLPLWRLSFDRNEIKTLSELGEELWSLAESNAALSLNGGKATFSFCYPFDHPLCLEIEKLIISVSGLSHTVTEHLDSFIANTVFASGKNNRQSVEI